MISPSDKYHVSDLEINMDKLIVELRNIGWMNPIAHKDRNFFTVYNSGVSHILATDLYSFMPCQLVYVNNNSPHEFRSLFFPFESKSSYPLNRVVAILDNYSVSRKEALNRYGIEPSMDNVIKFWVYSAAVEYKVFVGSYMANDSVPRERIRALSEDYIHELIKEDIDKEIAIMALTSSYAPLRPEDMNIDFHFSIEALKELEGLPLEYIHHILTR